MAHLLSGSAYPHVLYAIQYSVFKVQIYFNLQIVSSLQDENNSIIYISIFILNLVTIVVISLISNLR